MARDSILLDKSLKFAARIVKLHKYLLKEKHESIISKQIIRSATSIGANANEAIYGQSKADFLAKLHISLKETAETEYWLRLLALSDYITETEGQSLIKDCLEIKRILIASINTAAVPPLLVFALRTLSRSARSFGKNSSVNDMNLLGTPLACVHFDPGILILYAI